MEDALSAYGLSFGPSELLNDETGCGIAWDSTGSFGLISVTGEGVRVFVVAADDVPVNTRGGVRVGSDTAEVADAWPRHTGTDDYRSPAGGERLIIDVPGLEDGSEGSLGSDGGRAAMFDTSINNIVKWYRIGDSRFVSHINWCSSPEDSEKK